MRVLISGASGLIGSALAAHLRARSHTVTALVRRETGAGEHRWDPQRDDLSPEVFAGVDAVVHLAGAGIADHRWTSAYKRELRDSRVRSTALLAETIAALEDAPRVFVSASAIGWYGDRGDEVLDESSAGGNDFLARLCAEWEQATGPAVRAGVRVVLARTGVVLSTHGGALAKQLPLFRFGLGGRIGSGRQWQSWISIDDEVSAIEHLLGADVEGPVNLVAPEPVRNAEFTAVLGEVLHRPAFLRVPRLAPALRFGREMVDTVLLASQRVKPAVLGRVGYSFHHPDLRTALHALLGTTTN